ncbi:hypothetical protein E4U43_008248 [Claviceps pusilla]|uniref:Transcription factor Iwr1 domain-containing protein n=1 Tax=Claviceps pusilla TaxID=123648 RepID=A0A9P7ND28_9HYPO|nr:hypothetical protein E4U43_008248 [Claviceps pusilla]
MSIPPQLIRVKRKRVEEAPVTFLQFDQDSKRHLSGRNWAYQRRETTVSQIAPDSKSTQPVIHVSQPDQARSPRKAQNEGQASRSLEQQRSKDIPELPTEPRRFHVSRATLPKRANQTQDSGAVLKRTRCSPAVFIEWTRKKVAPKPRRNVAADHQAPEQVGTRATTPDVTTEETMAGRRQLKRPGVACKAPLAETGQKSQPINRTPLPDSFTSRHDEDMDKIARDMNQWVLNELGANLQSMDHMDQDKRPLRFKPKSPAKRYHERHPELAVQTPAKPQVDVAGDELSDAEDDDDDDDDDDDEWIIEEYVRIPAHSVAMDVLPTDVGILVLDEEEENMLFFGSALDEDDELGEDDEDENAENHYTADYPEDEVDSDDEYGRQAYMYRHGNNSDEEEFDETLYEEEDEMVLEGDADEDDDARMARIKEFMRRHSAFR